MRCAVCWNKTNSILPNRHSKQIQWVFEGGYNAKTNRITLGGTREKPIKSDFATATFQHFLYAFVSTESSSKCFSMPTFFLAGWASSHYPVAEFYQHFFCPFDKKNYCFMSAMTHKRKEVRVLKSGSPLM